MAERRSRATRLQDAIEVAHAAGYDVAPVVVSKPQGNFTYLAGTCPKGHDYRCVPARFVAGSRCMTCYQTSVVEAQLAAAAAEGFDVSVEVRPRPKKPGFTVKWFVGTCPSGHPINMSMSHFSSGHRCAPCSRNALHAARRAEVLAAAAAEGWSVSIEVASQASWLVGACPKGHPCRLRLDTWARGGRCDPCYEKAAHDKHLKQAASEDYQVRLEIRRHGAHHRAWLVGHCPVGHQYEAPIHRFCLGVRCAACAPTGYNPAHPAYFYLLHGTAPISGEGVFHFGISNRIARRLREHRKTGFTSPPLLLLHSNDGFAIQRFESSLKSQLRAAQVPTARAAGWKFSGSTETVLAELSEVGRVEELLVRAFWEADPEAQFSATPMPLTDLPSFARALVARYLSAVAA